MDTLSIDAKQRRLVFVANRSAGDGRRVTCTEPSPDALVARAAMLAANANITNPSGIGGSGGVAGGSSESAASIGFRDHTVQMLRDGYFRLCAAYMNGALNDEQYRHMILNADTFMVVVSALQILGSNPVAPAVAISAGGVSATASKDTATSSIDSENKSPNLVIQQVTGTAAPANAENAKMAAQIVRDYLSYRHAMARGQSAAFAARNKALK